MFNCLKYEILYTFLLWESAAKILSLKTLIGAILFRIIL